MTSIYSQLADCLYGGTLPYSCVDESDADFGYPHTNLLPALIDCLFANYEPLFVAECGSMLGGSALRMASAIKDKGYAADIVCIDPFTGDVNMWEWEQGLAKKNQWRFLGLQNGVPTIYKRFLANCKASSCEDIILPVNTTSVVGMKLIKRLYNKKKITSLPNYIYLDSAHEPDETLLELKLAWATLCDGGILFGDDWMWNAVQSDVLRLADCIGHENDLHFLSSIANQLPGAHVENNVLLYKGQWVVRKAKG